MAGWRATFRACVAAAVLLGAAPPAPPPPLSAADWSQAADLARRFVTRETPPSALASSPVERRVPGREVLAHYVPSLPLSMDDAPADADYYSRRLPTGLESQTTLMGRFGLWERPLPVGPWPKPIALATNAAIDVARARRIGVDGFIVDLFGLAHTNNWNNAIILLDAAAAAAPGFGIAPAPNMQTMPSVTVGALADALAVFARHPAGYREPDGHLLVVPFETDRQPPAFWQALEAEMARRGLPIDLIAQPVGAAPAPPYASVSIGLSFWGGRDPASGPSQAALAAQMRSATGRPVMLPVAPQDTRPKGDVFWEARNTEAFRSQWQSAIQAGVPWVHLVTWNDYSEGSEVSPASSTQFLFYDLAAYYIAWYKTGRPPAIERDALYYAYRRQIFDPGSPNPGPVYQQKGDTPLANDVELVGLLRGPATLQIALDGSRTSADVPGGVQAVRLPARPGTPCFRLARRGMTVQALRPAVAIEAQPTFKDALYGGGSSLRAYVPTVAVALAADGRSRLPPRPARPLASGDCPYR